MTADPKQLAEEILARDLTDPLWPGLTESVWAEDAKVLAHALLSALASLENAEKKCDEWIRQARAAEFERDSYRETLEAVAEWIDNNPEQEHAPLSDSGVVEFARAALSPARSSTAEEEA